MYNSVVHFEIPSDDHARAKKFYADAFGWPEFDMPGPDGMYTVVHTGEVDAERMPTKAGYINGGIGPRMGALQKPSITIAVESIDAHKTKIEAAGGRYLMEKKLVPNMGYYTYFEDSEGNTLGLWESLPGKM